MHPFAGSPGTVGGGVLAKDAGIANNAINRASRLDQLIQLAERLRAQAGNLAERTETVANRIIGMPPPAPTGATGAEPISESSLGRIEQTLTHATQLLEQLHSHLQRLEAL